MKKIPLHHIIGVAMYIDGEIQTLPSPNRHHNLIAKFPRPHHKHGEQGFVDGYGIFLSREEALKRAQSTGQVEKPLHLTMLFSEDL